MMVGHCKDHLRVLEKAIGQPGQRLAHILDRNLLGDHQPRDEGQGLMHMTHQLGEQGAIPHPGVEDPHSRVPNPQMRQFQPDLICHNRFLIGGRDEHRVGGAGVEEPGGGRHVDLSITGRPNSVDRDSSIGLS